ncbi:MAG: rRNA cytosine-C5-methyltransferase [bacterium]|nr:rRNA cytosine-C5-methyltransferase [bacterium]
MMTLSADFIAQMRAILPDEADALLAAITSTEPSVAIRVNPLKAPADAAPALRRVPWCDAGRYLAEREPFTFDVDFQSGRYYVQDASSMFVHHVLRHLVKEPVRYLDLCAAPGGKTTTAISALPQGSMVVANEIVNARARVLCENLQKWGAPRCVVTCNAPHHFGRLSHFFDVVAADVPCSGEGMMRKDEQACRQWSPALVKQCADLQRSIIADVWDALRPGGWLIYSTCTYNTLENEQMLAWMVHEYGAEPVAVPVPEQWHIHPAIEGNLPCYRFMPHRTEGEGLFMAVLRKPEAPRKEVRLKKAKATKAKPLPVPKDVRFRLKDADHFDFSVVNDEVVAVPADMAPIMPAFADLNVMHMGVNVGAIKGKNCVPSHSLALSSALNPAAFPTCEVDYLAAMAFLRGEALSLPQAPRGYVLLTYHSQPIGFVNNLGNRANNLYPKAWRVLSTHLPTVPPNIL